MDLSYHHLYIQMYDQLGSLFVCATYGRQNPNVSRHMEAL